MLGTLHFSIYFVKVRLRTVGIGAKHDGRLEAAQLGPSSIS